MRIVLAFAFLVVAAMGCASGGKNTPMVGDPPTAQRPPSNPRQEFAARFARIEKDMPATQVREILGNPDDIRLRDDFGGIDLYHVDAIWGYGVDHHLGLATLGSVAIDNEGKVKYFTGTHGGGDLVSRLGETELCRLLSLLDNVTGMGAYRFNPRSAIAAVNALQPLGRETGVAVLREYLDVSFRQVMEDDTGTIAVIRLLFDPPPASTQPATQDSDNFETIVRPGYFRQPGLGAAAWTPDDPTRFPRFPLAIVDDIPLVINDGYTLGGRAESAQEHLSGLVDGNAGWRKQPLRPTDDPTSVVPKMMSQLPRAQQENSNYEMMISNQLLHLVDTVYQPPPYNDDEAVNNDPDVARAILMQAADKIHSAPIHWDVRQSCYARADGTILPPVIAPAYRPNFFTPPFTNDPGFKLSLTIMRKGKKRVDLSTETNLDKKPHPMKTGIRVVQVGDGDKVLSANDNMKSSAEIDNPDDITKWSDENFTLPVGEKIQIEVTHGDQHFVSPVYQP